MVCRGLLEEEDVQREGVTRKPRNPCSGKCASPGIAVGGSRLKARRGKVRVKEGADREAEPEGSPHSTECLGIKLKNL